MKRIIAILLAVCLVSAMLAACGNKIDNGNNPGVNTGDQQNNIPGDQGNASGAVYDTDFVYDNGLEYIWERLDDKMKTNVAEMMNAIKSVSPICNLTYGVPVDEANDFLTFISNMCIDYTYLGTRFTFRDSDEDGVKETVYFTYNTDVISYEQDAWDITDQLNAKLDEIIASIPSGITEWEKVKYLHDYLVFSTTYSEDAKIPFTAYGALIENKATCQGYADAMHLLLHRAGFETVFVIGHGDSMNLTHKWNYVKLSDGQWYILDPTWADPARQTDPQYINYDYFLISDEYLLMDHHEKFDSPYYEVPVATSMEQSYHHVMGYECSSYEEAYACAEKQVRECVAEGRRYVYLRFTDMETFTEARQKLSLIEYGAELQYILKDVKADTGANIKAGSWQTYPKEGEISPLTIIITLKYEDD